MARLRKELRAFHNDGLYALRRDLYRGRHDASALPSRRTWTSCPLSYRLGQRGSTDRDTAGTGCNDFTMAWDGFEPEGEYLPETLLLEEVEREIRRRNQTVRRMKRRPTTTAARRRNL